VTSPNVRVLSADGIPPEYGQSEAAPLLQVKGLTTAFLVGRGHEAAAVDGISFDVYPGESVGFVGESGSGKSVTMLSVMGLIPKRAGRVVAGSALFQGRDLLKLNEKQLADIRGNDIAMIFQDPMTSLNPVFKISHQIAEALSRHRGLSFREGRRRAVELLEAVQIPSARSRVDDYPHEFSGGMRQRVMIAMALACEPKLLIADEPTTALDVTVQAQILEILAGLRKEFGMALIIVTHDLGVVASTTDRVNVMYAGEIVETGNVRRIFAAPRHPYTLGLLISIPRVDSDRSEDLATIPGRPPEIFRMPPGCRFAARCSYALPVCESTPPALSEVRHDPGRQIACWVDVDDGSRRNGASARKEASS